MRYILFLFGVASMYSCSIVNKVFRKTKQQVDSTSVVRAGSDSIATKDSFSVKKANVISEDGITIEFEKADTAGSADSTPVVSANDYVEIDWKKGTLKSTQPVRKITVSGKMNISYSDSLADHSRIQASDTLSSSTAIKKSIVETSRQVSRKTFLSLWWLLLLLLIPVFLLWKKIKPFIFKI